MLPISPTVHILTTPILQIACSSPECVETRMRTIGYVSHPSVFYRVPVDIIHVTVEVGLITDEVFPKTALP
jgi:hypothetical protein